MEKHTISTDPVTGEITGYTKENTIEELNETVARAKTAAREWASLTIDNRKEYLLKARNFIVANADRISLTVSRETGKTRFDAISTEVSNAAFAIDYYAKNAKRVLKRKRVKGGNILFINKYAYIDRVPFGVIGIISPWNYPFAIPFHEVAMALMAGNAVVLKTASQTLMSGKLIKEALEAAGLPEYVFNLVNMKGSIAGEAFINSGIGKLFFTGSVAVGQELMKKAADRLLPISLELGGNDPMIVCRDADIYQAVSGALWAGLSNCGQSCAGIERIYVAEDIYDDFVSLLKEKLSSLRQGPDTDFNVDIGSLTTAGQLETVKKHVEDAIEKGARITLGSKPLSDNPLYFRPVLIEDPTDDMLTMQDETFGPVLAIQKVKDTEEAVRRANDSQFGLTASVWTQNRQEAHAIASRIEAGAVTINDHLMSHSLAHTPWGGFKSSGLGRTHAEFGLEAMTQPRVVIDDLLPGRKRNMWWYPHDRSVYEGLKGGLNFLYTPSLEQKFEGAAALIKTFLRSFRAD
ncbi:MAG: aldehyde dehydrogenase family protein [Ignavibacteriaceae bacterium]|nr:aldehyde dehydrogenase family protein [Ignavibacteriaceae bacterium]